MGVRELELAGSEIQELLNVLDSNGLSKENRAYQIYTIRHKYAFLIVQYILLGRNSESAYMHDLDKLVMYGILSKSESSKLHRNHALHHIENAYTIQNYRDCVVDYECARFTKADKPLNAYDTIKSYFPSTYEILKPYLQTMGIDSANSIDIDINKCKSLMGNQLFIMRQKVVTMEKEMIKALLSGETIQSIAIKFNGSPIHHL